MLTWLRRPYGLTTESLYARQFSWTSTKYYASSAENPEYDYTAAREWYRKANLLESLRGFGEITYSRSSGPGGQNVNKVNSKAQLRIPVDRLLPLLPTALHKGILSSRYHAENSSSLVIQADESRKQQANKDTCYRKLNELIMDVYKHTVPGETTEDQKERVRKLQRAAKEARLKDKHIHSSKKQARSGGGRD
ncbi:peptidyl-tRNA hydrolase domain-containing protein [Exophiala viscosa]|uniref:Peptidyl-tRNA hydrolase domain-containing protein n=1 Tax=Exophiala viscosa TaxID=2486360 RepID=A0AAN6DL53_9EURO|nr:peptidyl-tRNA hydrolase domain-containing protein [Exophiala viscosa]